MSRLSAGLNSNPVNMVAKAQCSPCNMQLRLRTRNQSQTKNILCKNGLSVLHPKGDSRVCHAEFAHGVCTPSPLPDCHLQAIVAVDRARSYRESFSPQNCNEGGGKRAETRS